jgi:tRNA (guanine37-N1)-methyltransferase
MLQLQLQRAYAIEKLCLIIDEVILRVWQANILSFFPEIFPGPLGVSIAGRALAERLWQINAHDIRPYAIDKHGSVDEAPYGGGGGMVLRADVLGKAIDDVLLPNGNEIIYLTPRGSVFTQDMALEFANMSGINIICGRFEGIDERVITEYKIREVSMGDFLLSSGDVAAVPLLDACVRLLPGVIKRAAALHEESLGLCGDWRNLLEYPHYTRPERWRDLSVPEVLLSGNHALIKEWRLQQAMAKTKDVRPDLWKRYIDGKKI